MEVGRQMDVSQSRWPLALLTPEPGNIHNQSLENSTVVVVSHSPTPDSAVPHRGLRAASVSPPVR